MNYSTMAFVADETVIAVTCTFADFEKEYTFKYKTKKDEELKEGDLVLVESRGSSSTYGMAIVKVKTIDVEIDLVSTHGYNWITNKLDLTEIETLKKAEAKLISTIRSGRLKARRKAFKEALGITDIPTLEELSEV